MGSALLLVRLVSFFGMILDEAVLRMGWSLAGLALRTSTCEFGGETRPAHLTQTDVCGNV